METQTAFITRLDVDRHLCLAAKALTWLGGNVNIREDGRLTPLAMTRPVGGHIHDGAWGDDPVDRGLVSFGASASAPDNDGCIPLMVAWSIDHVTVIVVLMEFGDSPKLHCLTTGAH
jgi:hypothetical protein